MRGNRPVELPEDFWIPIPLDTNNITSLSPFLVPQDHLGSPGIFYSMSAFMFFLFVTGTAINTLTIACTAKYKKLRSHLNYILVNLAVANLIVSSVGSFTCFYCFAFRYMIFGPLGCKIEGFSATLGGKEAVIFHHYHTIEAKIFLCVLIACKAHVTVELQANRSKQGFFSCNLFSAIKQLSNNTGLVSSQSLQKKKSRS